MKLKEINIRDIILGVIVILLLWNFFGGSKDSPVVPHRTIEVSEKKGTTDTIVVETIREVKVPVYNNAGIKETIIVDQKYKALYEATKDALEKERLYLEAIQINEYKETIVDNDTIKIDAYAKTRGSLIDFKVDWKVLKDTITYKPEVITKMPKLSVVLGAELGIPTELGDNFVFKADVGLQNKNGDIFTVGADMNKTLYVGYKKTFKLIK